MAVNETGAIYKTLTFDGESSGTFGVYITGQAVYNAPTREVEMISIPGRSGQLALDKGRFENIEVSYPAGIFADNEEDFAEAISDFRNFLCSRNGYVRLQDDYNPNEYRMAIYKSGLEVEPSLLRAGEFEIIFDCKPQRWLTSGEEAIDVDSGDVISNPTLFEASPLLEVFGYGNIDISGQSIEVLDATLDEQILRDGFQTNSRVFPNTFSYSMDKNLGAISVGDTFYIDGVTVTENTHFTSVPLSYPNLFGVVLDTTVDSIHVSHSKTGDRDAQLVWKYPRLDFVYGTPLTTRNYSSVLIYIFTDSDGVDFQRTREYLFYAEYDGDKTVTFHIDGTSSFTIAGSGISGTIRRLVDVPPIIGVPSLSNLTKYVDLDIGECYAYQGGQLITWNNAAILPSDLPTLAPGANTITFDNTITELKVVPRWWKI